MKIKKFSNEELVIISIKGSTVMTNEQAGIFINEFVKSLHDNSIIPYIERFYGEEYRLKEVSECGKYRTGMIFKRYSYFLLVYRIINNFMICIQFTQEQYDTFHRECSNYKNWDKGLPLDLLSYTGLYRDRMNFKIDPSGTTGLIDNEFEFVEELDDIVLYYLIPEILRTEG